MPVTLTLREKEFEVKPGMMLLDALKKIDIVPESVIATRNGEMILDDEILKVINEEAARLLSLSRSTIYERMRGGTFPTCIQLGGKPVGWVEAEVDAWIEKQIADSRGGEKSGSRS